MNGITKEQADALFAQDYIEHVKAAEKIPSFSQHPKEIQAVLIDMTYNMGPTWYKKWPSTMAALEEKDYVTVANNIQGSLYAKQTKGRALNNASIIYTAGIAETRKTGTYSVRPISEVAATSEETTQSTSESSSAVAPALVNKDIKEQTAMANSQSLVSNTKTYDTASRVTAQPTVAVGINNNNSTIAESQNEERLLSMFS